MKIKDFRKETGLSQVEFAKKYGFNLRTLQDWEQERCNPPEYVIQMLNKKKLITDIEQIDVSREIQEIINGYSFRNLTLADINYTIADNRVTFNILNYTHIESVGELCIAFVNETSITATDALALNVTTILDNAEDLLAQELANERKKIISKIYVTPEKFAECIDSVFSNGYGYIAELHDVEPKRENITVDMLLDWLSQKGIGCADAYGFLNSFYEKL